VNRLFGSGAWFDYRKKWPAETTMIFEQFLTG
jgi:hypothetical protein